MRGEILPNHPSGVWSNMRRDLIEKALEISRQRREVLDAMRKAIYSGDRDSVFELARKLTGLTGNEERNRTNSSIN